MLRFYKEKFLLGQCEFVLETANNNKVLSFADLLNHWDRLHVCLRVEKYVQLPFKERLIDKATVYRQPAHLLNFSVQY